MRSQDGGARRTSVGLARKARPSGLRQSARSKAAARRLGTDDSSRRTSARASSLRPNPRPTTGIASTGPLERDARIILRESARALARVERSAAHAVAAAAEALVACLEAGGTVYFCGNGGSAADAQHFACELAGRYLLDRPPLAAIALTTNTSSISAIGNDYGFDQVYSRQLEGMGMPGDVLVAITTSGGSPNVIRAIEVAHRQGMTVIGMTGAKGARFAALCDLALVTPHDVTPRIQEGHLAMGHAYCELVERAMFAPRPSGRSSRR